MFTGMIYHLIERCKGGNQTRLQVKRTSRLRLKRKLKSKSNAFKTRNTRFVLRFERKRKIANAKIYKNKRDLYNIINDIHYMAINILRINQK